MEKKKPSAIAVLDLEGDIPHFSKPSEESSCEEEKSPNRSPSTPKVKKNPSLPCLFFIDTCEGEIEMTEEEVEEKEEISEQELFARTERLIGDFHRQLKIQREESFKRIQGLYRKPI